MSTFSGRKRSLRGPAPQRRSFCSSLYARTLRCELLEDRRLLAQLTVTTDQDIVDLNDGKTSLREAIFAANIVPGADEIVFDFGHDGPATILLTQGELKIEDSLTIAGPGAALLTIDASGNDPTPEVNNGDGSRVFNINNGSSALLIDVTLHGLAVTGADSNQNGGALLSFENLQLRNLIVNGNAATVGGGVNSQAGSLTVETTSFLGNESRYGQGAAIFSQGSITVVDTTVTGNHASLARNDSSAITAMETLSATRSTISNNSVIGSFSVGAAIITNSEIVLVDSTVSLNQKLPGIRARSADIRDSVISENDGTGIIIDQFGNRVAIRDSIINANRKGGIKLTGSSRARGDVSIVDSTISGNTGEELGGISISYGRNVSIENCIVSNNTSHVSEFPGFYRGGGGGIRIDFSGSTVASIIDTSITGNTVKTSNTSNGFGGGILISGGSSVISNCLISGNSADGAGGGIDNGGTLLITRTSIVNNSATDQGGGILSGGDLTISHSSVSDNTSGNGGGISAIGSLTISDSSIDRNHAVSSARIPQFFPGRGGGILGTNLNIVDSTIEGNTARDAGGGIYSTQDLHLVNSTVANNSASAGGGVWTQGGTIARSTISVNEANEGGGIQNSVLGLTVLDSTVSGNSALEGGGGIRNANGTLTLIGSTISGNDAQSGGGIDGAASVSFSTITANSGGGFVGDAILNHTIVAGNLSSAGTPQEVSGIVSSQFSLIGLGAEWLGPLADNGGPTPTHRLLPGSPAIDAGDPNLVAGANGVPEFDQRGAPHSRVIGNGIDIGAVESEGLLVDTLEDVSDGDFGRGDLSLREAIELANFYKNADTIRFDDALMADGPAMIVLRHGELKLTESVTIVGPGSDWLTIDASGNDPTPDLNDFLGSRDFNIDDGEFATEITVSISGMTLTGGDVDGSGGAIQSSESITLIDLQIVGNSARRGGGISGSRSTQIADCMIVSNFAEGVGGVAILASFDDAVSIVRTSIIGNVAENVGGVGISATGSTFISDCIVAENRANSSGGAGDITAFETDFMMTRCVVANNQARYSAGLSIDAVGRDASVTLSQLVINDNTATERTSGLSLRATNTSRILAGEIEIRGNSAPQGNAGLDLEASAGSEIIVDSSTVAANHSQRAGIDVFVWGTNFTTPGSVTIMNSTVSGNSSEADFGWGLYISSRSGLAGEGGLVRVAHCTIVGNSRGIRVVNSGNPPVVLTHVIVAQNQDSSGFTRDLNLQAGTTITHSVVGSNAGAPLPEAPVGSPDAQGNLVGGQIHGFIDPLLGPLADNGGLTLTHALLPGSPAINAGDPSATGLPEFDQRGAPFARVSGGRIDIGAYESQPTTGSYIADFDSDGDVDGRDFLLWQRGFGRVPATYGDGDATGNGMVDGNDLAVWQATYGNEPSAVSSPLSAVAVIPAGAGTQQSQVPNSSMAPWGVAEVGAIAHSPQTTVTTDQDIVDLNDGKTSLREAIFAANIVPGADEIVFDFGHGGPATILLTQGELKIEDSLTIAGPGAALLTIDAQQQSRIFNITAPKENFAFSGMTLTHGSTSGNGGAIQSASVGLLTLDGMRIVQNRALGNGAAGGAVYAKADVQISGSTLIENSTAGSLAGGGAVYAVNNVMVVGSTVTGNQTAGSNSNGGAILSYRSVVATETVIANNRTLGDSSSGGAISAGSIAIAASVVTGNGTYGANSAGGGIGLGARRGAGIVSSISDSNISDNFTFGNNSPGGGISTQNTIVLERSIISGNSTLGTNSAGGGLSAYSATLTDSRVEDNRTYGTNSSGGAAHSGSGRAGGWQISDTTLVGNKTYGDGSRGGALAVSGATTVSHSSFHDNATYGQQAGGGAVSSTGLSNFLVESSTFDGNTAKYGSGGAIFARSQVTIRDSLLNHNRSAGDGAGGGAVSQEGFNALTIVRCTLTENEAIGQSAAGGAIHSWSRVAIVQSEISGNQVVGQSARGGGIYSRESTTISDSTISGNRIVGTGGQGGGLSLRGGSFDSIINSTITGNQITGEQARGGGLFSYGRLDMKHSTVTDNRINSSGEAGGIWVKQPLGGPIGPGVRISHSIIAGNFVTTTASDLRSQPLLTYSLVGTNSGTTLTEAPVGSPDANGNLIGGPIHGVIDPLLAPLANNGGPTLTHALLPGSPAINAGQPASAGGGFPEFDQRGAPFARIVDGHIDIGAYEFQPAAGSLNGDFDGDGDVDGRDFLAWQRGFGRVENATRGNGDATGDGDVDGNDLAVWQETYGEEQVSANLKLQISESSIESVTTSHQRTQGTRLLTSALPSPLSTPLAVSRPTANSKAAALEGRHEVNIGHRDRAFDHWSLPKWPSADFGDIATRRATPRQTGPTPEGWPAAEFVPF